MFIEDNMAQPLFSFLRLLDLNDKLFDGFWQNLFFN